MQSLITSYLIQRKKCLLPGIGLLYVNNIPAAFDETHQQLLPPTEEIIFMNDPAGKSPGLVNYIAAENKIEFEEAENRLHDFCRKWKEQLTNGEHLHFATLGSLQKNGDGKLYFNNEPGFSFLQPIPVADFYKPETTVTPASTQTLDEPGNAAVDVKVKRSYWWVWALVLLAITGVLLYLHFLDHPFTPTGSGNQNKIVVDSAGATYEVP